MREVPFVGPLGALAAVAAVLLTVSCGGEEPVVETGPVVRPVKMLEVGAVGGGEASYPGRVAAAEQVDLSFRVGGPLVAFPVVEGQRLRRGATVARIDPRDFEIALRSARADFDKAEADLERNSRLYERDAVSKAQLDQTQALRDAAKAALDDAEAALGDTRLGAPFTGIVGTSFVENFEEVTPGQPIISLIDVEKVKVEVDLPESVVAGIRDGTGEDAVIFARFQQAPGRTFELEFSELAAQADARSQTYRATFVMRQPEGVNILPGMNATVFGEKKADDLGDGVVSLPAKAVSADDTGQPFVWVVDTAAMTVTKRLVTTGSLVGADMILVTDGLAAGETVAVSAVNTLRDGMQVSRYDG